MKMISRRAEHSIACCDTSREGTTIADAPVLPIDRKSSKGIKTQRRLAPAALLMALVLSLCLDAQQPYLQTQKQSDLDTPAGGQLVEWLKVFRQGDQDRFSQFISEHYSKGLIDGSSALERADRQARLFVESRGFDLREVQRSSPQEIVSLAQASLTGLWFRISLTVQPEPLHHITAYTTERIPPPGKIGDQHSVEGEGVAKEMRLFVDRLAAADAFSGTVLIAKDSEPILQAAYGFANRAWNIPNRLDTKFNIASMGKMFTAVSIGQLVEQGTLSFSDAFGKYLPDYPNKAIANKVTIHQLLTHTSGLPDLFGAGFIKDRTRLREVKDYFHLFVDQPLKFEPGARWEYSGSNYVVLGAIIERLSGETFFQYVRNHILKPAGMSNTDYYEIDTNTPNLAVGYTYFRNLGAADYAFHLGDRRNNWQDIQVKGGPTGGAYSTAMDMLRFSVALQTHKLLGAEVTGILTSGKVAARTVGTTATRWAYGFEVEEEAGKHVIGHFGGDLGVSSGLRLYPDLGYTFIVLSNYDTGGKIVEQKFHELMTGR